MFNWLKRKPVELPPPSTRDPKVVLEQLALLKEQSKVTGALFEAQKIQLDYWIWIVLPHIVEHQLVAFPPYGETIERRVEYFVKAQGKNPKDLDLRLSKLDEYVKFLLGSDIILKVVINDQPVFESGPNEPGTTKKSD